MAIAGQMLSYFEDQFSFVNHLPNRIRKKLYVRLYPTDHGWHQKERWHDYNPSINFDNGRKSIWNSVKNARLLIHSYNATSYLESLSLNIPTIIFWDTNIWEVKDDAVPYFQRLQDVGVFHKNPELAAAHVALIWDDVSSWWFSSDVQNAVNNLCNEYASSHPGILDRIEDVICEEYSVAQKM
jgi:putative transferase (TIGR04331 family)